MGTDHEPATVTHREMRNRSGEILRRVEAGETFRISNHGRVAAVLSPPQPTVLDELVENGQARPALEPPTTLRGIKRRASDLTSEQIIADLRGDRP